MKKQTLFSALLIGFSLSALASTAPVLRPLKVDKDFQMGCGCSVSNRSKDTVVFSDLEDKSPAIVRIDGHLQKLAFVSSTEKSGNPKMGDRFTRLYGKDATKLRLDYKTTFVCSPKDEGCEVTRYSVDVKVKDGSRSGAMKGLEGDCGC